jgi:hypothetical protein
LAQQSGISLVWVLTIILVLLIASGAALLAVNARFNSTAVEHEEQQAYYTALSTLDTVSRWIAAGCDLKASQKQQDAVKQLLEKAETSGGVDYPLGGLDSSLGECSLHLEYTDPPDKENLKLTATATYAGVTETLSMTMQQGQASTLQEDLLVSQYKDTQYDTRATELNALTTGGIVALYDTADDKDSTFNNSNKTLLDGLINASSNREARWTNVLLTSTKTGDRNDSEILGTRRFETTGSGGKGIDTRRFMVPANGRITIDPLEYDGSGDVTASSAANNIKITSLAIDNTAGKNVLFRLASGSSAQEGGLVSPSGTLQNRSIKRYASLVTLDFTDNAGETEDLSYKINGVTKTYTWHPNHWNKLDLFVQARGEVTSNLAFGPFAHKYNDYLDYWSYGDFVDNWNGKKSGESRELWGDTSIPIDVGIPIFPVDFGKNANFWILDGRGSNYVWFMQGTNVLDGTIYSTRVTVIGGALVRASAGGAGTTMYPNYTSDGLNRDVWGYVNDNPKTHIQYVETTTRYSQLIYNTDIILKAPASGIAYSAIRRPNTWQDRANTSYITAKDKEYNPTVTIKGGTIYVGERQSLTIFGAVSDNMWVSPDQIVVAKGGSLLIESSSYTNVLTDIYVDGGTVTINTGAKIKGNIYAYNGGTVNVTGNFTLLSPHDDGNNNVLTEAEAKDGILIYGSQLVGRVTGVTQPGTLILPGTGPELVVIAGSSNKVHMLGEVDAATLNNPSRQPFSAQTVEAIKKKLLCNDSDLTTGSCRHFGFLGGDWTAGAFGHG